MRAADPCHSTLVTRLAHGLHCSGQATDHTIRAAEGLARRLGFDGILLAGWDRVELLTRGDGGPTQVEVAEGAPLVINIRRVSALTGLCDDLAAGRVRGTSAELSAAVERASRSPGTSIPALAVASGAGATALAVVFGEVEPAALATVAAAGLSGGFLRGRLGASGHGLLAQDAGAAFVAGIGAAIAAKSGAIDDVRLAALCPCMILMPGPHLLNGATDLLFSRVTLGLSRLAFAATALLAISVGLVFGLGIGGYHLPVAAAASQVPLWRDVLAAGVAAAAYGTFYAMPAPMLAWPACAGMAAHAVHWACQDALGLDAPSAAALASAVAGAVLAPVASRFHLPFAGVGFAATVSMLPGIYLFPMADALVAIGRHGSAAGPALVAATLGDGVDAFLVLFGMTLGLVAPKILYDAWRRGPPRTGRSMPTSET